MWKHSIAALALAASASSGCILYGDDQAAGHFRATWSFLPENFDCGTGGTVEVSSLDLTTGQELFDVFDCHDGSGVTDPLFLGPYNVVVAYVAPDGARTEGP